MGEVKSDRVNGVQSDYHSVPINKYDYYRGDFYDLEYDEWDTQPKYKVVLNPSTICNYLQNNIINFVIILLVTIMYSNLTEIVSLAKDLFYSLSDITFNIPMLKMILKGIAVSVVTLVISNCIKFIFKTDNK